jgi:hypothetical protein
VASGAALAGEAVTVPYDITFDGTFRVTFLSADDGHSELTFMGEGTGVPFGHTFIDGSSHMEMGPNGCTPILEDQVTWRTHDGNLNVVNSGKDCLDLLSQPGRVLIVGSGATEVLSGTGAYAGATGAGAWTVVAEVQGPILVGVHGIFGPLRFSGNLELPG